MTFIFSTHDARVIKRARRVVTLEDGGIKSDQLAFGLLAINRQAQTEGR